MARSTILTQAEIFSAMSSSVAWTVPSQRYCGFQTTSVPPSEGWRSVSSVEVQLTYGKKHHFDSSRNLFGDEWLCGLDCPKSAIL
jgi:hypothetical protein